MNTNVYFIISLTTFFLAGCTAPEEEAPAFDFQNHPGAAVVGNNNVCAVYSDDTRTFNDDNPVPGGIQQYYFKESGISYIQGSSITFVDDTGEIETQQDTFGLDPFFSPFNKLAGEDFNYQTQLFATGQGIIVQQVTIHAERELNTFVRWSLYTPSAPGKKQISATDILEDGIYHRYDNEVILAFAVTAVGSQYNFDDTAGIATVTTPLHLDANTDTTLTFFIAAGTSDTEVITKMFEAEDNELFDKAYRYWNDWLEQTATPDFPNEHYERIYIANLYTVYASEFNGARQIQIPDTTGTSLAEKAQDYIIDGDYEKGNQLIHTMMENSNSYGLIPEIDTGSEFIEALNMLLREKVI